VNYPFNAATNNECYMLEYLHKLVSPSLFACMSSLWLWWRRRLPAGLRE